jgi:hypothetical protein
MSTRSSKQGDRSLRSLFIAGALAVSHYAKIHGTGAGRHQIIGQPTGPKITSRGF